jgi:multicomponent Na+:H+ antiporter subunit E
MTRPSTWRRFIGAAAPLALVWLGLNGSDLASWLIGAPAVLGVSALVARLPRHQTSDLRWARLPGFAFFFLGQSVLGGWDVARRVLERRPRIAPGFVDYETSLPAGSARRFYVAVISLLPGTLSTDVEDDRIVVHTLDLGAAPQAALEELERQVARIFSDPRISPA